MLSTAHTGDGMVWTRRNVKVGGQWRRVLVRRPTVVEKYNAYMGGVDKSDQLISNYNILQKTLRWWKTLFFHMVDVAVVNSYILFSDWQAKHPDVAELKRPKGYSHLEFREELVRQLGDITVDTPVPLYEKSKTKDNFADIRTDHIPTWTDMRHNCTVCYRLERVEKKVHFTCSSDICSAMKPAFCLNSTRNCFQVWHSPEFDIHRKGKGHW